MTGPVQQPIAEAPFGKLSDWAARAAESRAVRQPPVWRDRRRGAQTVRRGASALRCKSVVTPLLALTKERQASLRMKLSWTFAMFEIGAKASSSTKLTDDGLPRDCGRSVVP